MSELLIVSYRTGPVFLQRHILCRGFDTAFCGEPVPTTLLDQLDDARNPYVGKGTVTCHGCLSEFSGGRRSGHRTMAPEEIDLADVETAQSDAR